QARGEPPARRGVDGDRPGRSALIRDGRTKGATPRNRRPHPVVGMMARTIPTEGPGMPKFKRAAVVLTAVESARQWAHQNPDKATGYIDKATGFVAKRTRGKYRQQIGGLSSRA